jgi:hypothetical protein
MHMAPRRDRRDARRSERSRPRAWACALAAACSLVLLLGAGQAAARAAEPAPTTNSVTAPPPAAPASSADPRLDVSDARPDRPTIVCRGGTVAPVRCRAWRDRRRLRPRFVERDHAVLGNRAFGPVSFCARMGRHCA